jgi:hypothetical protein
MMVTRGTFVASGKVPRGPMKGCHVAPRILAIWSFIKSYMEAAGFDPRTSPLQRLHEFALANLPPFISCLQYENY